MKKEIKENFEKEWKKLFKKLTPFQQDLIWEGMLREVEKSRQEFADELMKKIEKKFTQGENTRFSDRNLKYHDGYNEALSDIIEIIKKTIIN